MAGTKIGFKRKIYVKDYLQYLQFMWYISVGLHITQYNSSQDTVDSKGLNTFHITLSVVWTVFVLPLSHYIKI